MALAYRVAEDGVVAGPGRLATRAALAALVPAAAIRSVAEVGERRGQRPEGEQREPLDRWTAELGCLLDCLVIAHELEDVALWVVDVNGPPMTPAVFKRRDVDSEALQASQFGVEIGLVDFEREMVQRCWLEMNRFAGILRKGHRQRFVEQADDLGVTAVSVRDLEEGDALELS